MHTSRIFIIIDDSKNSKKSHARFWPPNKKYVEFYDNPSIIIQFLIFENLSVNCYVFESIESVLELLMNVKSYFVNAIERVGVFFKEMSINTFFDI